MSNEPINRPAEPLGIIPYLPAVLETFDLDRLMGDHGVINDALPNLRRDEPTALLLDSNNLYRQALRNGFKIDYGKLKAIIEQRCDLRYAASYSAVDASDPKVDRWLDFMERCGYDLDTKDIIRYRDDRGDYITKGNMDTEMTIGAMKLSPGISHIILGTCDGDFIRLIEELKEGHFRRVSVLGIRGSSWQGMSRNLAKVADNFYDLTRIKDYVRYEESDDVQ